MKLNLILGIVLALLLTFTYFFEEVGYIRDKQQEEESRRLFDKNKLGKLLEIRTMNASLKRKGNIFYLAGSEFPADAVSIQKIFDILSQIKINRYLKKDEIREKDYSLFIPDTSRKMVFTFEKSELTFILGSKLEFSTSFYMEVRNNNERNLILAWDTSAKKGVYDTKKAHLTSEKYDRLKNIFKLTNDFFMDRAVFRVMDFGKEFSIWRKIKIKNSRNRVFEVDIQNRTTSPESLQLLGYNNDFFDRYYSELTRLRGTVVHYPGKPEQLKNKIATIVVNGKRTVNLELYKNYGERNGHFVKTSFGKAIYGIDRTGLRLFFSNVQDFWNKNLLPETFLKEKKQVKFYMKFDSKIEMVLRNFENFSVISNDTMYKPQNVSFRNFFDFLTRKADHVRPLDKGIISKKHFSFGIDDLFYHVVLKDGEVVILEPKKRYQFHYWVGERSPIGLKMKDYFKL